MRIELYASIGSLCCTHRGGRVVLKGVDGLGSLLERHGAVDCASVSERQQFPKGSLQKQGSDALVRKPKPSSVSRVLSHSSVPLNWLKSANIEGSQPCCEHEQRNKPLCVATRLKMSALAVSSSSRMSWESN